MSVIASGEARGNRDNYRVAAQPFPFEWASHERTPASEASFRLELGREDLEESRRGIISVRFLLHKKG